MLTKNRQLKCRKNEAFSPLLLQQLNYAKMFKRQEELAESKIMCINWRLHVVRVNGSQQKSLDIKIDNGLLFIIGGHIFFFLFRAFHKVFPFALFFFRPGSAHFCSLQHFRNQQITEEQGYWHSKKKMGNVSRHVQCL